MVSLVFVGFGHYTQAQTRGIGTWRAYLSHSRGVAGAAKDGQIYGITPGGMFAFNPVDSSTQTFSTVEGLSSIDATSIYQATQSNRIYLGFADGMINYFEDPSDIKQVSDIARNVNFTDKQVNDFFEDGKLLYIATNFGLVVFDQEQGLPLTDATQFADNPSRVPVLAVAVSGDFIYIQLEGGEIFRAPKDAPILRDPQVWAGADVQLGLSDTLTIRQLEANDLGVFLLTDIGVFTLENDQWEVYHSALMGTWGLLHVAPRAVGVSQFEFVNYVNAQGEVVSLFVDAFITDVVITGDRQAYCFTSAEGMYGYDAGTYFQVLPAGPKTNDIVRVDAEDGQLYIAAAGYDQTFVPTQSALGIYTYDLAADQWTIYDRQTGNLPETFNTGFARVYIDEIRDRVWVGSWGSGLGYFSGDSIVRSFNCTEGIPIIFPPCNPDDRTASRVSGIGTDPIGNTWVALDFAIPPLAVIRQDETIETVPNSRFPANHHIVDMVVDDFGSCWMVNRNQGLLVYTINDNTPDVLTDGRMLTIRNGAGLTSLENNSVLSIAKDKDGAIWVGTSDGVGVFYDTFSISVGEIVEASRPAVGNRFLLNNLTVLAIAVDGGNRKWIGTDDGLFLLSENGDEQLAVYTVDNSPLLSNRIIDIAVDDASGEVFVATDKGLVSFLSDATGPRAVCEEVFVFPNPATANDDRIIVRGTTEGAVVKITTIGGMLVREIEAQGGTATWDGLDNRGVRVKSGVYLALIAEDDGTNPCIGKFTVINE